jgi:hypothetical protein
MSSEQGLSQEGLPGRTDEKMAGHFFFSGYILIFYPNLFCNKTLHVLLQNKFG